MKILVVGDDAVAVRSLQRSLVEHRHEVVVTDGPGGLAALRAGADACVLDLLDGRAFLTRAREAGIDTPILCLTARDAAPRGPRAADEYLARPFGVGELLARLDALMRRQERRTRVGDLELDLASRRARVGARELPLSKKQFALLAFFVQHAGEVVTRHAALKDVFGYDFDPGTNIVDVHVAHLRSKIADERLRITTVRGIGYRLEDA